MTLTRTPRWEARQRNSAQVAFMLLPNRRQRPPKWVWMIRRTRRGPFRWMDTPWHRRVIPVMGRKALAKALHKDARRAES